MGVGLEGAARWLIDGDYNAGVIERQLGVEQWLAIGPLDRLDDEPRARRHCLLGETEFVRQFQAREAWHLKQVTDFRARSLAGPSITYTNCRSADSADRPPAGWTSC